MRDKTTELIIIDTFFLFASILLFFLDYNTIASAIIIGIFVFNIVNYFINSVRIRYSLMGHKKAIIYAMIDNQNVMNLYYEPKKANEISRKVYKEIKDSFDDSLVGKYKDHFLIITRITAKSELISKVTKLNDKIGLILDDELFSLGLRYGIHICDDEGFNSNENRANIACNNAKKDHIDYYSLYDDADVETLVKEKKILSNLVKSIKNHEFEIYFQPKFDYKAKEIVGSEALARLKRENEIVPASEFIEVAEKYGFTTYLDKYVLKEVCKKIAEMKKDKIDFRTISINVSRTTLGENGIIEYYDSILKKYDVKRKEVEFEVTERNEKGYVSTNRQVHELSKKFNVSIDDFGVGNSSLSILMEDNIKTIKIDRQFVRDESESGRKLLNNIIKLIKELGFEMVAEGVETSEQQEYLKSHGCNIIQGYYFSKPLSFDDYKKIIEEWGNKNGFKGDN